MDNNWSKCKLHKNIELCYIRDGFPRKKNAVLLDFVQIPPPRPLPQFGQLFLNTKNVDLGDIQNDSLSKIPLK